MPLTRASSSLVSAVFRIFREPSEAVAELLKATEWLKPELGPD